MSLSIIEEMAAHHDAIGVSELSKRMDASKPKIYRHLRTLLTQGYVDQDEQTDKYFLTQKLFHLGQSIAAHTDFLVEARRVMGRLREQTGLAVSVGQLEEDGVRILDILRHRADIEISTSPGTLFDFRSSAQGKVALAFAGSGVEYTLAGTLSEELRREVAGIAQCGWAVAPSETLVGINALAAPIFNADSEMVGTMAVVGSLQHLPAQPQAHLISAILDATRTVSERLGYRREKIA